MTDVLASRWRRPLLGESVAATVAGAGLLAGAVGLLTWSPVAGRFPLFVGILLCEIAGLSVLANRGLGLLGSWATVFGTAATYYHHYCSTGTLLVDSSRHLSSWPGVVTRCPVSGGTPPETGTIVAMGLLYAGIFGTLAVLLGRQTTTIA